MKQYSVRVEGKEIGFVEDRFSQVYDCQVQSGEKWVRTTSGEFPGSFKGQRTAGFVRQGETNLSHTFYSNHPEFIHLNGKAAIVSVAPIYDSKET